MKVFLDIDGVMVHGNPQKKVELDNDGFYIFMSKAIEIFNKINTEEIILSTSHRDRFAIDEWSSILKRRGLKFSKVSKINNNNIYSSRKEDIENHIEKYNINISEIIIIDDDKSLYNIKNNLKNRIVITSSYRGLGDYELDIINKIIEISNFEIKKHSTKSKHCLYTHKISYKDNTKLKFKNAIIKNLKKK